MSMDWYRDLAITVFAFVATAALVFLAVLTYSLYGRVRELMKSINHTSAVLETLSTRLAGRLATLVQMVTLVEGIGKGAETVTDFIQKVTKGGDRDGKR